MKRHDSAVRLWLQSPDFIIIYRFIVIFYRDKRLVVVKNNYFYPFYGFQSRIKPAARAHARPQGDFYSHLPYFCKLLRLCRKHPP